VSAPVDQHGDTIPAPRAPEGCEDDGDEHETMLPPAPVTKRSETRGERR
jgi:hypothetical protein